MGLVAEITDIVVRESGEQFKGLMHSVQAKLTLKEGTNIVHEETFQENHKHIYAIVDTMEKIRVKMTATKTKIEAERVLKIEAEKEIPNMLAKLSAKEVE